MSEQWASRWRTLSPLWVRLSSFSRATSWGRVYHTCILMESTYAWRCTKRVPSFQWSIPVRRQWVIAWRQHGLNLAQSVNRNTSNTRVFPRGQSLSKGSAGTTIELSDQNFSFLMLLVVWSIHFFRVSLVGTSKSLEEHILSTLLIKFEFASSSVPTAGCSFPADPTTPVSVGILWDLDSSLDKRLTVASEWRTKDDNYLMLILKFRWVIRTEKNESRWSVVKSSEKNYELSLPFKWWRCSHFQLNEWNKLWAWPFSWF